MIIAESTVYSSYLQGVMHTRERVDGGVQDSEKAQCLDPMEKMGIAEVFDLAHEVLIDTSSG